LINLILSVVSLLPALIICALKVFVFKVILSQLWKSKTVRAFVCSDYSESQIAVIGILLTIGKSIIKMGEDGGGEPSTQ